MSVCQWLCSSTLEFNKGLEIYFQAWSLSGGETLLSNITIYSSWPTILVHGTYIRLYLRNKCTFVEWNRLFDLFKACSNRKFGIKRKYFPSHVRKEFWVIPSNINTMFLSAYSDQNFGRVECKVKNDIYSILFNWRPCFSLNLLSLTSEGSFFILVLKLVNTTEKVFFWEISEFTWVSKG